MSSTTAAVPTETTAAPTVSTRSTSLNLLSLKPDLVRKSTSLTFSNHGGGGGSNHGGGGGGGVCSSKFKDHYKVGAKLNEEKSSGKKIHLCKGRTSGVERAVKMIRKTRWDKDDSVRTFHEYSILQRLDHPNLLKMYEHYEGEWQHYFVSELCAGGDFGEELDSWGALTEQDASLLIKRLLACINYCHQNNVVHCDLNPEHILLDGSRDLEQIKLCGFGNAILLDPAEPVDQAHPPRRSTSSHHAGRSPTRAATKRRGSLQYMAPEVFQQAVTLKSDIWSIGVLAHLALSDELPFSVQQMRFTTVKGSQDVSLDFSADCWKNVSDQAKDFIRYLLVTDVNARPTAQAALQHPWVRKVRYPSEDGNGANRESVTRAILQRVKSTTTLASSSRMKKAVNAFISSQLLLKKEREEIDRVFRDLDITNDGRLSKMEVRAAFLKYHLSSIDMEKLDKIFESLDSNNTGYLEYSEFVIATMSEKDLLGNKKLRKAFDFFDVDKSGYISAANLKQVLSIVAQTEEQKEEAIDDEVVEQMIAEVDKDGDGQLSFQDFLAMMLVNAYKSDDSQGALFGSRGLAKNLIQRDQSIRFAVKDFVAKHPGKLNEHYKIHDMLGEGGYGQVYLCTHRQTGDERAVKVMRKSRYDQDRNERMEEEFRILKDLDHPNILKMYNLFEDYHHFFIVMDICKGGDMCDELDNWGALPEGEAAVVIRQLLSSINYCHTQNIVHCDLKPDNILLEHGRELADIKIIDFGMAQKFKDNERLHLYRGTVEYMAPEILQEKISYGPKCDIWSCGVIAYLILSNRFPFNGADRAELKNNIRKGKYTFDDDPWEYLSLPARDFVQTLLTVNEEDRPTAQQALAHEWIADVRAVGEDFDSSTTSLALENFSKFNSRPNKLRQATISLIGAQLLMKEEKECIDDIFRQLDIAANGRLSKEEVKRGYKEYFRHPLTDEEIDDMFDRVDGDGSGYIEYSEFVVAAMNENDLFSKTKLEAAFKVFDKNGDGSISTEDFLNVLKSYSESESGSPDDVAIQKIIKEADANNDGLITFDDFVSLMMMSADA